MYAVMVVLQDFSAHVLGVAIDESYLMPYDGYRHGHHVDKALASRVPDGILSGDSQAVRCRVGGCASCLGDNVDLHGIVVEGRTRASTPSSCTTE